MTKASFIPAPVVRRLSLYLRQLEALAPEHKPTVSSRELSVGLGLSDAQVRKDLAYFGQFGQPGIGYDVQALISRMRRILGTDRVWRVVLVGAGNLGKALLSYKGFKKKNFHIVAVFDADPEKVGKPATPDRSLAVQPLEEMAAVVKATKARLGIITVPAEAAQGAANRLIEAGVEGLLNFAPTVLNAPPHVVVSSVDLSVQLEQLSFQVNLSR